jgi:hypothetical protein
MHQNRNHHYPILLAAAATTMADAYAEQQVGQKWADECCAISSFQAVRGSSNRY